MHNEGAVRGPSDGRNLTAHIVHELGRAIVTGRYLSGKPFPVEAELCRQYGASRPVLREAVKMLAAKGLLASRPRQGTTVQCEEQWNLLDPNVLRWILERKFSIDLLIDFTDTRLAIEPRAAALAAETANDWQCAQITAAIDRMVAADKGDDDALSADIAFHVAVLNASNNRFLRQFTDLSETTLRLSIRRTNEYKGVPRANTEDHKRVSDAIMAWDPKAASREMYQLIQGALDLLLSRGSPPKRRTPKQRDRAIESRNRGSDT